MGNDDMIQAIRGEKKTTMSDDEDLNLMREAYDALPTDDVTEIYRWNIAGMTPDEAEG